MTRRRSPGRSRGHRDRIDRAERRPVTAPDGARDLASADQDEAQEAALEVEEAQHSGEAS